MERGIRVLFHRNRVRAVAIARGEPDPGADSDPGGIVVLPQVRSARDSGRLPAQKMLSTLDEVDADLSWCTGFRPTLRPLRHLLNGHSPRA